MFLQRICCDSAQHPCCADAAPAPGHPASLCPHKRVYLIKESMSLTQARSDSLRVRKPCGCGHVFLIPMLNWLQKQLMELCMTGRRGRDPVGHLLQFDFDKHSNFFTLIFHPSWLGR